LEFVASCGLPYVQHKTVFADITSKHYIGIQTRHVAEWTLELFTVCPQKSKPLVF